MIFFILQNAMLHLVCKTMPKLCVPNAKTRLSQTQIEYMTPSKKKKKKKNDEISSPPYPYLEQ